MHIISRKTLRVFSLLHPDAQPGLDHWYRVARHAEWSDITDVRLAFPHADAVKLASENRATVFNLAGNKYRLVIIFHYNRSKAYIAEVLTHADYSKQKWTDRL